MKNFKLFLSAAAISLMLSNSLFASFPDVSDTHENVDAINYMQTSKIIEGYPDGSYQPDRKINRAEFTKIVVGAFFTSDQIKKCDTSKLKFPDTAKDTWYSPFICLAVEEGIIQGYPDGTFKPGDNINFVEAAKIILEASTTKEYKDPTWYKPYVEGLADAKAIPTTISKFEHPITRGEMAEVIYRLLESIKTKPSLTYADLDKIANPPTNQYDPTAIELGDTIGDFKVDSITKTLDKTVVTFKNEVEVTGHYTYYGNNTLFQNEVCIDKLDQDSLDALPTTDSSLTDFFCFSNTTEAQTEFAPVDSTGTTTIVIDEYTQTTITGGKAIDTAKLVKVVSKTPDANNGGSNNGPIIPFPFDPNNPPIISLANEIDILITSVGDYVSGLKITAIKEADFAKQLSNTNAIVEFEGEIEVASHFEFTPVLSLNFPDTVCLSNLDATSQNVIPYLKGSDPSTAIICFTNNTFAKSELAIPDNKGYGKFKIKNLTLNKGINNDVYTAELSSVIEKNEYLSFPDPTNPIIAPIDPFQDIIIAP